MSGFFVDLVNCKYFWSCCMYGEWPCSC